MNSQQITLNKIRERIVRDTKDNIEAIMLQDEESRNEDELDMLNDRLSKFSVQDGTLAL